jgi:hypothetical protein
MNMPVVGAAAATTIADYTVSTTATDAALLLLLLLVLLLLLLVPLCCCCYCMMPSVKHHLQLLGHKCKGSHSCVPTRTARLLEAHISLCVVQQKTVSTASYPMCHH